jgi:tetratricopeptide (TPR) repeat protein
MLALISIIVMLAIYVPARQETMGRIVDYVDYWDTDIMQNSYYRAVMNNMSMLRESGKENEAIEYIEKLISDNEGHQANQCSLLTIYERFLISDYKYDKALVKAEEAERLAITSVQKDNLYNDLLHIWTMLGNDEKVGEYEGKIEENRRDVEAEEKKAFEGREHEEE